MMNYVGFVITIALILAGILFNRSDFKDLRRELIDVRKDMAAMQLALSKDIGDLRTEMRSDYVRKQ
jgi:hypothetical protein